ncbi:hypothetical protein ES703_71754 [subsurface metagenome]
MQQLPDPKTLADSIADGVVEVAEGPARVAKNVAGVAESFATEMKSNMDNVKSRLPDDPSVIADAAVKAVGQTAKAGLGMIEGIGRGFMDTFEAVKGQIERVIR